MSREQLRDNLTKLRELAKRAATQDEVRQIISRIAQLSRAYRVQNAIGIAQDPSTQAMELDSLYVNRPHIEFLSHKIAEAVRDVERGQNRKLIVSMPPRAGKSTLTSKFAPLWMLRRHPEWKIMMTSYDGGLAIGWAREQRIMIEDNPSLGIALKRDGGAGGRWQTLEGGGMFATGVGGALTGRGARVMIIDDPIADFVSAHSPRIRDNLWNWWLSVAQTRLEPPHLVLVTMTRWHEDDFVGRLLSREYEGDPRDWEQIVLPAVSDREDDPLGRREGEPLISPLLDETPEQASLRWKDTKETVGGYTFEAMYQQRPSPQKGAIFDAGWWRYWTTDPNKATEDGRIVYIDPEGMAAGQWVDSWDCAFKGGEGASSWVVGQRWVREGANRYLVAQKRGRWGFTQTIAEMKKWAKQDDHLVSPWGHYVHQRLIEDKANGPAIIDTLKDVIPGLKPINPHTSKEARARAITPEVESGNVYLPHPTDPHNGWVQELLSELRNFPHDQNDDQVDTLTQALSFLRGPGRGGITVPGAVRTPGQPGATFTRTNGVAGRTAPARASRTIRRSY